MTVTSSMQVLWVGTRMECMRHDSVPFRLLAQCKALCVGARMGRMRHDSVPFMFQLNVMGWNQNGNMRHDSVPFHLSEYCVLEPEWDV